MLKFLEHVGRLLSGEGNYTVPAYEPTSWVNGAHNWPRIGGDNTLEYSDFYNENGDFETGYLVGIALIPGILLATFFIWGCSLICMKKGCCGCSKTVRTALFAIFGIASALGWFLSIAANARAANGVSLMVESVEDLQAYARDIIDVTDDSIALISEFEQNYNDADTFCSSIVLPGGLPFDVPELPDLSELGLSDLTETLGEVEEAFDPLLNGDVDDVLETVEDGLDKRETAYLIFTIVIIAITTVFVLSGSLRSVDSLPGSLMTITKCLSKSSTCIVFVVGILFLFLLWITITVTAIIATPLADFCVPSPDTTIRNLIAGNVDGNFTAESICEDPQYEALCYYQDCQGDSPLAEYQYDIDGDVANITSLLVNFTDTMAALREDLATADPGTNYSGFYTNCTDAVTDLSATLNEIPQLVDDIYATADCPAINPIYVKAVKSSLCGDIATGLIQTNFTWVIGCYFLMFAMSVYRTMEFDASFEEVGSAEVDVYVEKE